MCYSKNPKQIQLYMREKEQTCIKMKHIGSFFNVDLKMEINCGGIEEAIVKE